MPNVITWKLSQNSATNQLVEIVAPVQPLDLNAASRSLPSGVYTTFRTFQRTRILPVDSHISRLEESAALVNGAIHLDRSRLLSALASGLGVFYRRHPTVGDARVRFTLDLEREPGTVYLSLEALTTPTEADYQHGVQATTSHLHRDNPRAKWTGFITVAEPARQQLAPGVNECLMVDEEGQILEGLSSNFFAILDGAVWTADTGILNGITRTLVLDTAQQARIPVRLQPVRLDQLPQVEEAFLTSASRSVLPVVRIDDVQIGNGEPGPITRHIMDLYWEGIRSRLTEVEAGG